MGLSFKRVELFELFKAWFAISLAFGILSVSYLVPVYGSLLGFFYSFVISLVTAGLGFVVHELAHKVIAQKHYCSAEFKSNDFMLVLAVLMSFVGFIFAAPGAVIIKGGVTKKQNGEISFAGPFSNFLLALVFLPGWLLSKNLLGFFFFQGFFINSWLGLFNLIPARPFDGFVIYRWNKWYYVLLAFGLLIFVVVSFLF